MKENKIGLIIMNGAQELGKKVSDRISNILSVSDEELIISHECPRFTTGEGKAQLLKSVRGRDVYIISDVTNYTCEFFMRGKKTYMSPDEHYMDIKRVVSACGGKCSRLTVIMPYLYGGRQDRRNGRESLDAAFVLKEITKMGVHNIITFDAHNHCVENAIPNNGFDNIMPIYQMIKAIVRSSAIDIANTVMVSPDEGAIKRNAEYARWFKMELGMFYKVRDLANTSNGQNPIKKHDYMGGNIAEKSALVADDAIATGNTLLSVANNLKQLGAKNTSFLTTFPQFTEGLDKFDQAYQKGIIHRVFGTNLIYRSPDLLNREWYIDVDISKYLAYIIISIYQETSINSLLNPAEKIKRFLD